MKNTWIPLATACALVIGVYAYMAQSSVLELLGPSAADAYYNLLVQGFRAGQLSLKKEVPPGLAKLADPYDTDVNIVYQYAPYGLHDLSYYKGKLYLLWGITPALILFLPYVALTGHYLFNREAVAIFCTIGFLTAVVLLRALWRRYLSEVSVWVVSACALALGLVSGVPMLLAQADVYEVPISCGYMLTMLGLAAIWRALHRPEQSCRWLAAASLAYGLAVGARPTLLFGGIILLVPVAQAWREKRRVWTLLIAAAVPITLIGLGLMLYNFRRFENPFEFGMRYQLGGQRQDRMQFLSLRYFWFNFRVYFLEPVRWKARFPFVNEIAVLPVPKGHNGIAEGFGILTNTPLAWLVLAAPLVWRNRSPQAVSILRWFVTAAGLLVGICAFTLGLVCGANLRYEVDFLPALVLLAVVGILGLERVLTIRPVWRCAARWGWGLLLGFSVVFNILVSVKYYAEAHKRVGTELLIAGKVDQAIGQCQEALRIRPDDAGAHLHLGNALLRAGKVPEAVEQLKQALRINPDDVEAHFNLGNALMDSGRMPEAIEHLEQALRLKPDFAKAHYNLGTALMQSGRMPEAIEHLEQALQIQPDYAEAHNNLGTALKNSGRMPDAIWHYEQALRIKPDYAVAHYNLGNALMQSGRMPEAIEHWEQALRIKPDFAEAHYNLGTVLMQSGRMPEAIEHLEQALQIQPDYAEAHNNLGMALAQTGRIEEAIAHYQQALRINPDYAEAHYNLGTVFLQAGRVQEAIGHYEQALRIKPDYAEAHNNLGVALWQSGKLEEAIGHFQQALRIKPDYADAHYDLGVALEQTGKLREAIDHYQQALRIKPDFTEARNALARLQAGQ
ncbi:MAG: tetratricopeptide repeat protein [Verrucomicrobiia bacterium]